MVKLCAKFVWECIWCVPCWLMVFAYNSSKWIWGCSYAVCYGIAKLDFNKFKEAINHIKGDEE